MRVLESRIVTQDEKLMVLTLNSKITPLLSSGLLSSIIVLFLMFGTVFLISNLTNSLHMFMMPDIHFIIFSSFFTFMGAVAARLKVTQYNLHKASYRGSGGLDFLAMLVNFIFPLLVFSYLLVLQLVLLGPFTAKDPWGALIIFIMTSFFLTMVTIQMWNLIFRNVLSVMAAVDWMLILDNEHFIHTLKLRFDEAKRYPGPFSLMLISIKDFDNLVKKFSKNKITEVQEKLIDFVNRSMRTIDIVARLEKGQYVGVILHCSGVEAKIPAERVEELVKNFAIKDKGKEFTPSFNFGIARFDQAMQNEKELYEIALQAVNSATDENSIVVI